MYTQDLQRRLDLERAERNKSDSATLKLLSELKEDSQKANELRDQESRLVNLVINGIQKFGIKRIARRLQS